jgi:hypothetical protein
MTKWEFDSGIVATRHKTFNIVFQRVYYVKYKLGDKRRLITAGFVYSKLKDEDKKKFITSLLDDKKEGSVDNVSSLGKFVGSLSKVASIMDFDVRESGDQKPKDPTSIEHVFEPITNDIHDPENYLTLSHFETHLNECDVTKCVCTLTNDEESAKRISEVLCLETLSPEIE